MFFNNLQHKNDGFNINNFVKFEFDGHARLASGSKLQGHQIFPIEISILQSPANSEYPINSQLPGKPAQYKDQTPSLFKELFHR